MILTPYQPPNIRQKMLKMDKSRVRILYGSESNTSCFSNYSEYQYMDYSESDSSQNSNSHVTVTCVSRLSESKGSRRRTAMRQKSSKSRDGLLHPMSAKYSNFDWNESQYSINLSPSNMSSGNMENEPNNNQFLKPETEFPSKSNVLVKGTNGHKKSVKLEVKAGGKQTIIMEASTASEKRVSRNQRRVSIADSGSGHSLKGSPTAARRKSCDYTSTGARIPAEVHRRSLQLSNSSGSDLTPRLSLDGVSSRPFPRKGSSLVFNGNCAADGATKGNGSAEYSTVELDAIRTVVLQKIVKSSWYPRDLQSKHASAGSAGDFEEVVNTLCKSVK